MVNAKKVKDEIVQWIRDFFKKNGDDCFAVVGISGGKDSSVTGALCATALGADRVYGVLMPQGEQHDSDVSRELVKFLNIKHAVINIKDSVDSLFAAIEKSGLPLNGQAKTNTPARMRMAALYAVSAMVGGRVVNTGNLSEAWVGYFTKFGDGAGDLSPLSRLTASEVKIIGRELGLPSMFIDKVPEDGLSGLTDEENMGFSYGVLDKLIREGECEDPAIKKKIDDLRQNNRHKLNPMPFYELPFEEIIAPLS
jgi:NAD+ synthase